MGYKVVASLLRSSLRSSHNSNPLSHPSLLPHSSLSQLQRIKSGIFEGKDEADKRNNARNTLSTIVESIVPTREPSDESDDQPKQVDIPSDAIEFLVDVGRAAAHLQFDDLAGTIIEHCKNTKIVGSPTFRVKLDYLKCELQAKELDNKDSITDETPGAKASDPSAKRKVGKMKSTNRITACSFLTPPPPPQHNHHPDLGAFFQEIPPPEQARCSPRRRPPTFPSRRGAQAPRSHHHVRPSPGGS